MWVSITGYGRDDREARRVAFGDDAAVAGGLIAGARADPVFCADAVADPLAGLAAAAAALDCHGAGGAWLVDVSMAAGRRLVRPPAAVRRARGRTGRRAPRPAPPTGAAPALGRDTERRAGRARQRERQVDGL